MSLQGTDAEIRSALDDVNLPNMLLVMFTSETQQRPMLVYAYTVLQRMYIQNCEQQTGIYILILLKVRILST